MINGLCNDYIAKLQELVESYCFKEIVNYDETCFEWETRNQRTYDYRVASRVKGISTTKYGKSVTVLLMTGGNKHKFPALIVFAETKGVISSKIRDKHKFP